MTIEESNPKKKGLIDAKETVFILIFLL